MSITHRAILNLQSANPSVKKVAKTSGNPTTEAEYLASVYWIVSEANGTAEIATGNPPYTWAQVQAAIAAIEAADVKEANNAAILAQIVAKEAQSLRSLLELSVERDTPGTLSAQDKAFSQNKSRTLVQEIAALRRQLVP